MAGPSTHVPIAIPPPVDIPDDIFAPMPTNLRVSQLQARLQSLAPLQTTIRHRHHQAAELPMADLQADI